MPAHSVASTKFASLFFHSVRAFTGGLLTLLVAGFFGALLIRFGAGYESDERQLQPGISGEAAQAMAQENAKNSNVIAFYGRYLAQAMHGDFGISRSLDLPVGELVRSRLPVSLRLLGSGLIAGWAFGLALAVAATYFRGPIFSAGAEALSGMALSFPAAVFALIIFLTRGPVFLVLAMAVFPRVFRYARDLFQRSRNTPKVEAARARGVPERLIFLRYVIRSAWAPLIALAGVSFSIAFGALIPVEVVCDIPGIGQLAWTAAKYRDLPVLVSLTLLVTFITVAGNSLAEILSDGRTSEA